MSEPQIKSVLPRGISAASPDEVAASQRARLLAAMKKLAARDGYPSVTIAALVAEARVAKPTFYLRFADKQACMLELLDELSGELLGTMMREVSTGKDTHERLELGLTSFLSFLASDLDAAKVFLVESQRAGEEASERVTAAHNVFADFYQRSREELRAITPGLPPISRTRTLAAIGAVNEPVVAAIRRGDGENLLELREELTEVLFAIAFDTV